MSFRRTLCLVLVQPRRCNRIKLVVIFILIRKWAKTLNVLNTDKRIIRAKNKYQRVDWAFLY